MLISAVRIRNLCAAKDLTLTCEPLTVLVGRNGAGKSTVLRALELFYASTPQLTASDYYAEDTSVPVEIAVTFSELSAAARAQFAGYLDSASLSVVRVLQLQGGKVVAKYHGETLQCPDFVAMRGMLAARDITNAYKDLRQIATYAELPDVKSKDAALDALREWELLHPESCVRARDDGQFFGFAEVAQGYLGRHTRLIRIPAVRDASGDASEGRGSPITQLMDLVVRRTFASRDDVAALRAEIKEKYKAIVEPTGTGQVAELATSLSSTLKTFVPDASVVLTWGAPGELELPMPRADVRVREDGHLSPVERTGHGTQRAFILTLLQHLACTTDSSAPSEGEAAAVEAKGPNLILLVEEPELYQHPTRQRHFASTLLRLASGRIPGVAERTQVLYCTHSPLFVGLDRFDQVRLARKEAGADGQPRVCTIAEASLSAVADKLWRGWGEPGAAFDASGLRTRLAAIMTPWIAEGFFADVAVLVEGESDRAAILATAERLGADLEAEGVAVLPCIGKPNLDRPAVIFSSLGIPTYVVWDADKGKKEPKPDTNKALCRIIGIQPVEFPEGSSPRHAVFAVDLESALRDELGSERVASITHDLAVELGISGGSTLKNPHAMRELVHRAYSDGATSPTLEAIVQGVLALKAAGQASATIVA